MGLVVRSRRRFLQGSLALVGLGVFTGCGTPPRFTHEPAVIPRIGWLSAGVSTNAGRLIAFRQGLGELGYVEGQTIAIEERWADGKTERLPELAAELARLQVAVIIAGGTVAIRAAQEATHTIPIIMALSSDPVGEGLVQSLAKPGGNITGVTSITSELAGKRLELLKATLTQASPVAFISDPASSDSATQFREMEGPARALAIELLPVEVRSLSDLEGAFRTAKARRAVALYVAGGGLFSTFRPRIVDLATQHQLPAMYTELSYIGDGGLMAYAPDGDADFRRAATYVDKILKGARPADLPIERPTKIDFVINLKAARSIGLSIPQSVLQQATEVIQ